MKAKINIMENSSVPFFQIDFSISQTLDKLSLSELIKRKFPNIQLFPREKFLLNERFIEWLRKGYKVTTIRYRRGGIDFPVKKMMSVFPTRDFSSRLSGREVGKVRISKFSVKKFGDLDDMDAKRDGFDRIEELKEVLFHIYGRIQDREYISIYNIELI
jgi:hypothetical protein